MVDMMMFVWRFLVDAGNFNMLRSVMKTLGSCMALGFLALRLSFRQVPWEALRALLGQSVYGGRVDSVFDQQLLEGFVSSLFQPKSFDLNFALCR